MAKKDTITKKAQELFNGETPFFKSKQNIFILGAEFAIQEIEDIIIKKKKEYEIKDKEIFEANRLNFIVANSNQFRIEMCDEILNIIRK